MIKIVIHKTYSGEEHDHVILLDSEVDYATKYALFNSLLDKCGGFDVEWVRADTLG